MQSTVLLRAGDPVDLSSISSAQLLDVVGSRSGRHDGTVTLSDDDRTVIFTPGVPFSPGETVAVRFPGTIRLKSGGEVRPAGFWFTIAGSTPPHRPLSEQSPADVFGPLPAGAAVASTPGLGKTEQPDTLPISFPPVASTIYGTPARGRLFLSNVRFQGSFTPFLMILDDSGTPVFYRKMTDFCADFKEQPNGMLTYFDTFMGRFYGMDSTYSVIDSFYCGNGYDTDLHELRLLPDGHALLLGTDPETVDMSDAVPGGDPQAVVTGLVLQELDRNKNVVFQWRSWDHYQITDATHENLTAHSIDYVHGNAIELDGDGNILLSCRHMDEITKINRATGEIMWRMGGLHNEFTFVNDSIGYSHQHAIRKLDNGDLILFDNGNFHTPPFSRGVEYRVDEAAKTATLVWQYRHSPDAYSPAMGYVQRLDGGHTLIGWGATNPTVTEVAGDGSKVFELSFDPGEFSYRAYRFEWKQDPVFTAVPTAVSLSNNYPNPFNGVTTFFVELSVPADVTLKVFDILGREVATLLDGVRRPAGVYQTTLDLESMPSGVYFCRLSAGSMSVTRKMTLVR